MCICTMDIYLPLGMCICTMDIYLPLGMCICTMDIYLPLDKSCLVNIENDNVHKSCYKITTLTLLLPSHCFDIAIAFTLL